MYCPNHGETLAEHRCTGCAEPFCSSCLVNIKGKPYCSDCKILAVEAMSCETANEALKYALIGMVCVGLILGPAAIFKALRAKAEIAANPQFTGSGKANAALFIGVTDLVHWVLGLISQLRVF